MINISLELWLFIMFILGVGIVVSMRLEGFDRIGKASIIFILAFVIMLALKYFYSLVWTALFVCMLIAFLKKFGAIILLWVPLALFIWVPYQAPLPGFLVNLFGDSGVVGLVISTGFFLWGIYALAASRLRNDVIQQTPYWHLLGIFLLGAALAFCFGFFIRPIPDFNTKDALIFLHKICIVSFFLYILTIQSVRNVKDAEKIMIAFLFGAVVMALFILRGQRPEVYDVPGLAEDTRTEFMGLFALPFGLVLPVGGNTASAYFAMAALLSFSLWLNGLSHWQKFVGLFVFIFTSTMIVIMSTRGIWISIVPCILLIIFLSVKQRRVTLRKCFVRLLIALCIVFTVYSLFGLTDINNRIESLMHRDILSWDESFITRVEQYGKLTLVFIANPFGVGFMQQYTPDTIHPHSLYLKLALMTGIIGLVSYLFFLILIMRYLYNKLSLVSQGYWIVIGAIAVIFLIFIYGFSGDVLARFYTNTSFVLICAVAMAVARLTEKE